MATASIHEVIKKLEALNEKQLRLVLVHMFRDLNFQEVFEAHGTTEFGKDIVFYETSKLGKTVWHACVVKAKPINQSGLNDVVRQVGECFR